MWRELIEGLLARTEHKPKPEFSRPAGILELIGVEETLEVKLPDELKSFLRETNGVSDEYGCNHIWEAQRIEQDNIAIRADQEYKQIYMPFDNLLFFGDAGNGDQFAFIVINGEVRGTEVFVWDHENDSRTWVAPSLKKYLEWWLSGKLQY